MSTLFDDLRQAIRTSWNQPAYTAVVVLTLALGIGANTAIFSVVNGVLLAPLRYQDSQDLTAVWSRFLPESGQESARSRLSIPEYVDYRDQNQTMEDVAAFIRMGVTITSSENDPERVAGGLATANLFRLLRAEAALGRTFVAQEGLPGADQVVVLEHAYWQSRFGGDPQIVGKSIRANGVDREVVGVMPSSFDYPRADEPHPASVWIPLVIDPENAYNRERHQFQVIGRLAPGTTLETAKAEMQTLMAAWKDEYPENHTGHDLYLLPLLEDVTGNVRPALLLLLAATGFVLLIVCANVASVVLARGEARLNEVAIRTALGAGRARIVQLLFTESFLLSALGGILGALIAHFGVVALIDLHAGNLPRVESVGVDSAVLAFAGLTTLMTAFLFGLFPALHAAAGDVQSHLKEGARGTSVGSGRLRFRRGLVIAEVALSFILILGAGLMMKSLSQLLSVDPGFRSDHTLVTWLVLPSSDYSDTERVTSFYRQLIERLQALPGVESASAASSLPLIFASPRSNSFEKEDKAQPGPGEIAWSADLSAVRPGFFETLSVRLQHGRLFDEADSASALPTALVNQAMAKRFWPAEDPVGQRIRLDESRSWMTIVGIVDDIRYQDLSSEAQPTFYLAHDQTEATVGRPFTGMVLTLRTSGDPMALARPLRQQLVELDPNLPLVGLQTMQDLVDTSVARPRFTTVLLGMFAVLALVLGATGIYGVLAYSVALRRREIGIRKALGARPAQLAAMIVGQGMTTVLLGLAIGGVASFGVVRAMTSLLYGVSLTDVSTYVLVALTLAGVALLSCWLPAARALRVDPATALRSD